MAEKQKQEEEGSQLCPAMEEDSQHVTAYSNQENQIRGICYCPLS